MKQRSQSPQKQDLLKARWKSFTSRWFPLSSKSWIGLSLILISMLATIVLVQGNKSETTFWAARGVLIPGHILQAKDLQVIGVRIQHSASHYISRDSMIVGAIVHRTVFDGELIPRSALVDSATTLSTRSVPVKVARNDLPSNLGVGDSVDLYHVADSNSSFNEKSDSSAELVLASLVVIAIDSKSKDYGGEVGLTLQVATSRVLDLVKTFRNGRLVVVRSAI